MTYPELNKKSPSYFSKAVYSLHTVPVNHTSFTEGFAGSGIGISVNANGDIQF